MELTRGYIPAAPTNTNSDEFMLKQYTLLKASEPRDEAGILVGVELGPLEVLHTTVPGQILIMGVRGPCKVYIYFYEDMDGCLRLGIQGPGS